MNTKNPLVSILIPGFKPQWLDLCIYSCISQTYQNVEILVGDDTEDGIVSDIASKWSRFNVKVHRNENKSSGITNRWNLFEKSTGEYIKYVYDDDFLFPSSVEALVTASEQHSAAMAFHNRLTIGEHGQRLPDLPRINAPGASNQTQIFLVPDEFIYKNVINANRNLIGEPSNCIFKREVLQKEIESQCEYISRKTLFLGDVKSYLYAARSEFPIVFVNLALSAFRVHEQQNSVGHFRPAGFYEWDVLKRSIFNQGFLTDQEFEVGLNNQKKLYEQMSDEYILKDKFIAIASKSNKSNKFLDAEFRAIIAEADELLSQ